MIVRIGVDIISISRISTSLEKAVFVDRILTKREQSRELTPQYVAGRWAAKEAIKKCLPSLSRWHDVEILAGNEGEPVVVLSGTGTLRADQRIHVSISHELENSVAIAILEQV